MSQREIVGIDYAEGKDWSASLDVDQDAITKQMAQALGLSEEFLTGDPAPSLTAGLIKNLRAELTDPVRVAEREARRKMFTDYMLDLQYQMFLKMAFFIVTRRGVAVSIVVPKTEIKHFRSLRTAKVWNKRRKKENAKRV